MPYIISVVSLKRGVGKSTIARMIAFEFVRMARMDGGCRKVLLANQDPSQTKRHDARYRCQTYECPDLVLANANKYSLKSGN